MHAYPPRGFDWQIWTCPMLFAGLVLTIVILLLRRRTSATSRTIGGMCVVGATLWFLLNLPKFQALPEIAPRTQCKNNLKTLATGVHEFHKQHERLPAPTTNEAGSPVSWRISLLPFLGREQLGASYDVSKAWDDAANRSVAMREPREIYHCGSNRTPRDVEDRWYTAYALLTGAGTPFPPEQPLTLDDISDGTSQTILIAEACGQNIVWTEPRDVDVLRLNGKVNAPGYSSGSSEGILSSWHRGGGATCAMADGSVRFLSQNIDGDVLRALTTAAGKDEPGEF